MFFHQLDCNLPGGCRGALGERTLVAVGQRAQCAEKHFPRDDRSRGYGKVGFSMVFLNEFDFSAFLHEGPQYLTRIAELVRNSAGALGHDFEEVFDRPGMAPGENGVDIFHAGVQAVIGARADGHHTEAPAQELAQVAPKIERPVVARDPFAVADVHLPHGRSEGGIHEGGRHHQWSEQITLSALVNAHMRLDCLRIENVLVADLHGLEHERLENELHEIRGALALNETFAALVESDVVIRRFGSDDGIGNGFEAVIAVPENAAKFALLFGCERVSERGSLLHGA